MREGIESFADEELACRARAGSAPCFEEIVRRYQVPLARFLAKRFPSRRDVEDILQDTFLRAWQSLHLFDERYLFRTWLYTIAYRLAISRGRRREESEQRLAEDAPSVAPRPETATLQEDERQNLWRTAREILTEEQFTALWLHYVEDIPAGDVAKILNRTWVSVKTMMHRSRQKLLPYLVDGGPASSEAVAATSDRRQNKISLQTQVGSRQVDHG